MLRDPPRTIRADEPRLVSFTSVQFFDIGLKGIFLRISPETKARARNVPNFAFVVVRLIGGRVLKPIYDAR